MSRASDSDRHEAVKIRSQRLLQEARDASKKKCNYDSVDMRLEMRTRLSDRAGFGPYDWQLDVAEALLVGLDGIIIAGTGSGKTIPFMLPLFIHPEKMILILSPLKVLQRDQARRFKKMKIPAVAVNRDTWSPSMLKHLNETRQGAILSSPEMCLKHPEFRKWLTAKETTNEIMAIIVDEAHCISQWGGDFRPVYSQIEKLRAFMPPDIPVLLTSATLPPAALADCCSRMKLDVKDSFMLNLGNHRPNITMSVLRMDGSKDYKAVYNNLPDPNFITSAEDLQLSLQTLSTRHRFCVEISVYDMVTNSAVTLTSFMPIGRPRRNDG
ncbi:P-loop containing nucleoside triphosphate hydrolase protein [Amanita muscaria]